MDERTVGDLGQAGQTFLLLELLRYTRPVEVLEQKLAALEALDDLGRPRHVPAMKEILRIFHD